MSNIISAYASAVGFKNVGEEVYRGRIHTCHLESVRKALTDMEFTMVHQKPNFEIWSTKDDAEVVLINHSS